MATDDGANLLAGYKRAANILKQAGQDSTPAEAGAHDDGATGPRLPPGSTTAHDTALLAALNTPEPPASAAVADERSNYALAPPAYLRPPTHAFFDPLFDPHPHPGARPSSL